jgi:pantetheine-phosphate adenylyltransferase
MSDTGSLTGLGGTFDHFHAGHQEFLQFASGLGQTLLIGVIIDQQTQGKEYDYLIEKYDVRVKSVVNFCQGQGISAQIVPLSDTYGPTITADSPVNQLAVTTQSKSGAVAINAKRVALELPKLPIHVCQLATDQTGQPITSTRIRAGQVSREGVVYAKIIDGGLRLNNLAREFFAQPQGRLILEPTKQLARSSELTVCVVGDIALASFIQNNWRYDLGVFDGRSQRKPIAGLSPVLSQADQTTTNPAGEISKNLVTALQSWLTKNFKHLRIDGEEDLTAVALALLLPLESVIYYGQRNQGMVEMIVSEKLKNRVAEALVTGLVTESFPNLQNLLQ